jgi:predicted DCC family thiol-disulfide oxidoreductase YuxK
MIDQLKGFLPLLLFDGECILCNRLVKFILRRQAQPGFFFGSLQSTAGQVIRYSNRSLANTDSLMVVTGIIGTRPVVQVKSEAVLFIITRLKYPWRVLSIIKIFPHVILDRAYDLIAVYRYKIWGRTTGCLIPDSADQHRFIDSLNG